MRYLNYVSKSLLYGAKKTEFVHYPLFVKPADLKLHAESRHQSGIVRLITKMALQEVVWVNSDLLT